MSLEVVAGTGHDGGTCGSSCASSTSSSICGQGRRHHHQLQVWTLHWCRHCLPWNPLGLQGWEQWQVQLRGQRLVRPLAQRLLSQPVGSLLAVVGCCHQRTRGRVVQRHLGLCVQLHRLG